MNNKNKRSSNHEDEENPIENIDSNSSYGVTMEYADIESDSSNYCDSESKEYNITTDDDLMKMTREEKKDIRYLSIFDNNYGEFDEEIMVLDSVDQLKKWKQR